MILALLQARFSSSRLPGKVLLPLLDKPMLLQQVDRIRRAAAIDKLVVATSTDGTDDKIAETCDAYGVEYFRGSLIDVLDRFYRAAVAYKPDHVVRLTGDGPLADPVIIDAVVDLHLSGGYDYTSNDHPPTFPDGLDVEVFRRHCLEEAWQEALLPSQREHVTPFMYNYPDRYRIGNYLNSADLSALRWTVDTAEDLVLVRKIYEALYPANRAFTMDDILQLFRQNPALTETNSMYQRNEGYLKSLANDHNH